MRKWTVSADTMVAARMDAARPYWADPSQHEHAREIEVGWHDDSHEVRCALARMLGEPEPEPPEEDLPPTWGGKVLAILIAIVVTALLFVGSETIGEGLW